MRKARIVVIGAGSMKFTVNIAASLMESESLSDSELVLYDIDSERLALICRYIEAFMRHRGGRLSVRIEPSREKALEGADFVIVTVAIGGLRLKQMDVDICLKHGIMQVKGDTTGPAGVLRGLRHIPFFLELAHDMERLCPKAVMLNLSNPLSVITGAVAQKTHIRIIGLCTTILSIRDDFAKKLNLNPERLTLISAGVNHFTWLTDLFLDGARKMELIEDTLIPLYNDLPVTVELYKEYGMFPIPGYKYASEFFPFYGEQIGFSAFNAQEVSDANVKAIALMNSELDEQREFTLIHDNMDAKTLTALMESLIRPVASAPSVHIINYPNMGQLSWLPLGTILEGPALVCGEQISPLCVGEFTTSIRRFLSDIVYRHSLIIEAGVTGDRKTVMEALLADPLIPSVETARALMDELLDLQRDYLPAFWKISS